MVKIAFYKAQYGDYIDNMISLWTRGPYSHCEIYLESLGVCCSCSMRENELRFKNINLFDDHWDLVPTDLDELETLDKYKPEIGCKYDLRGLILTQIFDLNIQNANKWFCSEFCAFILNLSKPYRFNPNKLYSYLCQS